LPSGDNIVCGIDASFMFRAAMQTCPLLHLKRLFAAQLPQAEQRRAGGVENDLYREGRSRQRPKLIGADVLEE